MEVVVLANLLLVLGIVIFVLTVSDILLSDDQKKTLDLLSVRVWSVLDDLRRTSLTDWLKRPIVRKLIFAVLLAWPSIPLVLFYRSIMRSAFPLDRDSSETEADPVPTATIHVDPQWIEFIALAIGAFLGIYVAWKVITRILTRQSWIHPTLALTMIVLTLGSLYFFGSGHTYTRGYFINNYFVAVAFFTVVCFAFSFIESLILAWILSVMPLALSIIASVLLRITEFIARRIAEYPKGLVLALSGLLAAIAGFLKLWVKSA
jgi:hypothetical protein